MNKIVYDLEVYPNLFICGVKPLDGDPVLFEISEYRNDLAALQAAISTFKLMIGFNNINFDYPVLHYLLNVAEYEPVSPALWWPKVQMIFAGQDTDRFAHLVPWYQHRVPQLDLFSIHHFGNPAKRTSLKKLQFNMRSESIEDLPIAPGTWLTREQIEQIREYNIHDLTETEKFYHLSREQIEFREQLGDEYRNADDTSVGKKFIIKKLEERSPGCCFYSDRSPRNTHRSQIPLVEVIFPYISFEHPALRAHLESLKNTTIIETKGSLTACIEIERFQLHFGNGGLHGSVSSEIVEGDVILDLDVAAYYPSLAISNRLFPEHLGDTFVDVYRELRDERNLHEKGSKANKMLKLGNNAVFGNSNSVYSCFYDPKYTMATTVNGQLLICMLIEKFLGYVPGLRIIQANTDGVTIQFKHDHIAKINRICDWWQQFTTLDLEQVPYKRMFIRDVNNYIAEKTNGKRKRKGAYEYDGLEWHKDHSALIVPRAAEASMCDGMPVYSMLREHKDPFDFMILARATGGARLELDDGAPLTKHTRFYASIGGREIIKVMPPLAGKTVERRIVINKGRKSTICNRIAPVENVDYDFYMREVNKLVIHK